MCVCHYVCVRVCLACIHVHVCVCVCVCARALVQAYDCLSVCVCVCVCMRACMNVYSIDLYHCMYAAHMFI